MLPQRKKLRLENYDYSQCNAYFVTLCTHNRQQLFDTIEPSPVGATLRGRPNNPDKMIEKWINELENKVWQRSYYDHIIRNEKDLEEKRDYILTNPIRWLEKTSCPD